jgi:hypothetical protein
LNRTSETTFFRMTPRTRPASEFHSTWSPLLNVLAITAETILNRQHVLIQGASGLPADISKLQAAKQA